MQAAAIEFLNTFHFCHPEPVEALAYVGGECDGDRSGAD
jgi:hypothetical protein